MKQLVISMVVYNRLDMTESCVSLLRANTTGDWKLILWDNGSKKEVEDYFKEICETDSRIEYIRSEENVGFIKAHNEVFEKFKDDCEYFAVLNNDLIISEVGWNQRMIEALEKNDKLAQVGNIQKFGHINEEMWGVRYHDGRTPDYIEGACFIAKTKIISDNLPTLFDDKYLKFAYWEDSDLSLRLRALGYEIDEVPVNVRHIGTQTLNNEKVPENLGKIMASNRVQFKDRWEIFIKSKRRVKILVKRRGARGDVLLTEPILNALIYKYPYSEIFVATDFPEILSYCGLPIQAGQNVAGSFDRIIDLDLAYEKRPLMPIVDAYAQEAGVILDRKVPVYDPGLKWEENGDQVIIANSDPSWNSRTWGSENWKEVFATLKERGFRIIEVGLTSYLGVGEKAKTRSVRDVAMLMKSAQCYVGPDNLLLHLAQSIGLPVVALFGCICPSLRITDWSKAKAVWLDQDELDCSGCHHLESSPRVFTECRKEKVECLERITPKRFLSVFFDTPFGIETKCLSESENVRYDTQKPQPVKQEPRMTQAQRDLMILIEAQNIRTDPQRFRLAKSIAGRHFVG